MRPYRITQRNPQRYSKAFDNSRTTVTSAEKRFRYLWYHSDTLQTITGDHSSGPESLVLAHRETCVWKQNLYHDSKVNSEQSCG